MLIQDLLIDLAQKDIKLWLVDDKLKINAPRGTLNAELKNTLAERKLEIIAFLKSPTNNEKIPIIKNIPAISRDKRLNLSIAQQRLWSLIKLQPNSDVYNINSSYRLRGTLDHARLERSINEIISRHEVLRTTFHEEKGETYIEISAPYPLKFKKTELKLPTLEYSGTNIKDQLRAQTNYIFNLSEGPLWVFDIFKISDDDHIISITIHHIIYDGWSNELFINEIASIYNNQSTELLLPVDIQYADYAAWHNAISEKGQLNKQRDYWKSQLNNTTRELIIPTDTKTPARSKESNNNQTFTISNTTYHLLNNLSRTEGVTLFITLLAAYNVLLHRYTGQEDLSICLPAACRNRRDIENTIGYFNNILVIRNNLSNNPSLCNVIARVKKTFLSSLENQEFPFQELMKFQHLARTSFTKGLFSFRNTSDHQLILNGLEVEEINIRKDTADFNLAMYMELNNGSLIGTVEYSATSFNKETITKLIDNFVETLTIFCSDTSISLADLKELSTPISAIEKLLHKHSKIDGAVVVQTQTSTGNQNLAAYIVPNQYDIPNTNEIRSYLDEQLPNYRVPYSITPIAYIPLLADGTTDNTALPLPHSTRDKSSREFVAPKTILEKKIAQIWKEVLWQDDDISILDDFFELGGHSLLAAQLVVKIENQLGERLPTSALLEISNFKKFIECLEANTSATNIGSNTKELSQLCGLSTDIYRKLFAHTSNWKGKRASSSSIISGQNTEGTKQAIFWCFQGNHEYDQLAKYLGKEQPVYAMRSGHLVMEKSQENINLLAAYYVKEILEIQAISPFIIGGNCQSAQISFQIAKQLTEQGHEITLLCLQEQFVPFLYRGRVAFFYGEDSGRNPLHYFNQPEISWQKFYSGGFTVTTITGGHGNFFKEPNIQVLAKALETQIELAQLENQKHPNSNNSNNKLNYLIDDAYLASITTQDTIYASPGESMTLKLHVKNTSTQSWDISASHLLTLGYSWLNKRGRNILFIDPGEPLQKKLTSGQQTTESLNLSIPNRPGKYILEIDIVDNDIWFKDKASTAKRINVKVSWLYFPVKYLRLIFNLS
ncbi:MAG: hypothetical protein COB22_00075 [Cycloclasticus sp.]|nr:MAG: hypothetical protein COB22_00075 [Cycloclasticus sp.]